MNIIRIVQGLERYPVNLRQPRKLGESLAGFKRAQALLDEQIHLTAGDNPGMARPVRARGARSRTAASGGSYARSTTDDWRDHYNNVRARRPWGKKPPKRRSGCGLYHDAVAYGADYDRPASAGLFTWTFRASANVRKS
jgi:hypothetical protein